MLKRSAYRAATILFGLSLVAGAPARAQGPAFLVKDINTQFIPLSSNPREAVTIGNRTFFVAGFRSTVWSTDGTPEGTRKLKTLNLFSFDPFDPFNSPSLTDVNGTLFFVDRSRNAEVELWKSDGTETLLVASNIATSLIRSPLLTSANGRLFFVVVNASGSVLWRSDGTAAGTVQVKDLPCCAIRLINTDSTLFLTINEELWRSDGTEAGTIPMTDADGDGLASVNESEVVGSTVFFTAASPTVRGRQLWAVDASAGQARLLTRFNYEPRGLTNFNGSLFFFAPGNPSQSRWSLLRSDGTESGTAVVAELADVTSVTPFNAIELNGRLLFSAFTAAYDSPLCQLWISDGTLEGTEKIRDAPGPASDCPSSFVKGDGVVFFAGTDDISGRELWVTDGTEVGTRRVRDIRLGELGSNATPLAVVNGSLLFGADDGVTGAELWRSDGTEEHTALLANLNNESEQPSYPHDLSNINGTLFFNAEDGIHGRELWKSDGTELGTSLVVDIAPGAEGREPFGFTAFRGNLFFVGYDSQTGFELWQSDGTPEGSRRVTDIGGPQGSILSGITVIGETLVFAANDDATGVELWRSDGTAEGTTLLADVNPGNESSEPAVLSVANGTLFFSAANVLGGRELWKTDGTAAGTSLVADIGQERDGSLLGGAVADDSTIYFGAADGAHGYELWKSDGTSENTTQVVDIYLGPNSSLTPYSDLVIIGRTIFFAADDGIHGPELWKSDGTSAGTSLVKDISPGWSGSGPAVLTRVGNDLFFAACTQATGYELWKSDGSEAGTVLVKDLVPGPGSRWVQRSGTCPVAQSFPVSPERGTAGLSNGDGSGFTAPSFTAVGDHLLFYSFPFDVIFESDGTEAGTRLLTSMTPDGPLVTVGPLIYFSSFELWAIPVASLGLCGNGVVDPGETCDDDGESPACDADCSQPVCGDGLTNRAAGEGCDDGNGVDGDCCSNDCSARPGGTPCDDLDACTDVDACDESGRCLSGDLLTCNDGRVSTRDFCDSTGGCTQVSFCPADCNGDGAVSIDELVTVVDMVIAQPTTLACPSADRDHDGVVSIADLLSGVEHALRGCPAADPAFGSVAAPKGA